MTPILIFSTGSSILCDVEESLARAGIEIAAGIQNRAGANYCSALTLDPPALSDRLLALPFLIPLFTPKNRQTAYEEAKALGLTKPFALIDPTVIRARQIEIGDGAYINAGCVIGAQSRFGDFAFINRGACIGHHAQIGAFASIGPGVTLAGHVTVEAGATIATGATVLPSLRIGVNAIVGAGSVVTKDVPDGALVFGSPARIQRQIA